jgi:anaerobic magnesium-protoporphyrin IX monomethyl ester cyclase
MAGVLFLNPPSPDGDIFIRDLCRVGRRSQERVIWPQTSLAQLAAMVADRWSVEVLDCIALGMTWDALRRRIEKQTPRLLVTHVTAPTLTNDLYATFLAKALGAVTVAFGTHVTPLARETLEAFPSLDIVIRGEPEWTLRELVDALDTIQGYEPKVLTGIRGLAYRRDGEVVEAPNRALGDLNDLPLPRHDLLPLEHYRLPMLEGKYAFVTTSRGCPARCTFCIKHVMWQNSVRLRSPERIVEELHLLASLGVRNIHFEADLFTANREQVERICRLILDQGLDIRWTCNSRVDTVDPELLSSMKQAGCWMIAWGIESASPRVLRRAKKGITPEKAERALRWSREAGIGNWGYFIIGLPGETEESIAQTTRFAKELPLDLALFHVAVPYPGTPFYHEALERGWLKMERWEDYDMTASTVLSYPELPSERLVEATRHATKAWSLRPGPMWTFLRKAAHPRNWKSLWQIGWQQLNWMRG